MFYKFYVWFIQFFYVIYNSWFPKPKKIVIDIVSDYIDKNKKRLLDSFDSKENFNINVDPTFYDKKELLKVLTLDSNVLEEQWKTRILFENSPRGNIIMFYNVFKQGFSYYCDSTGIPYNILNAVAMKYVLTFNCRDFFVDNQVTGDSNESSFIKIYHKEDEKEKTEESKKPLLHKTNGTAFAKLKNYRLQPLEKPTETTKPEEPKEKEKQYIRNTFISLGKICNFKLLQTVQKKNLLNGFQSKILDGLDSETKLQKQVMSYSDYKRLAKKNN